MEKTEEQFTNLHIVKCSSGTKEHTYLLGRDFMTVQAGKENLVAVFGYHRLLNGVKLANSCDGVYPGYTDGTVKCWEARVASEKPVQLFKDYPSNIFIHFDINWNDHIICGGTEKMNSQDLSTTKDPITHSNDVTQVHFHPSNPSMIISGSPDGLVNVFDINVDNEEGALVTTCNLISSVSCISWSGKGHKQIYCMTHDERFYWWDLNHLDADEPITCLNIQDVGEMVNVKEDILDYLIGGLYHEKMETLLDCLLSFLWITKEGFGLAHVTSLQGGHTVTVRSFCWNVQDDSLLTGGEDKTFIKKESMKIASSANDSYKRKKKQC
uniref:WD repeat-containing protein 89 n=1 Tax=Nomascus leucogenys TaxID=61853 RepID=A0A2I3GGB0_NOMLE